jgi:hypothetical protein
VPQRRMHATPVQHAAATVAVIFGLVGLLGFLPGFTADIGALEFAGPNSHAMLLGLFSVSVVHNVIHLLFAVAGLAFATAPRAARGFLFTAGGIYLLLALLGVLTQAGGANILSFNVADDWLHLGLGALMIGLGFLPARVSQPE